MLGEVVVRVEGPLGLVARQGRRQLPGMLRVYPPFDSRDEAELRVNKARILEVGLRSAQGRGGGTEFEFVLRATLTVVSLSAVAGCVNHTRNIAERATFDLGCTVTEADVRPLPGQYTWGVIACGCTATYIASPTLPYTLNSVTGESCAVAPHPCIEGESR